MLYNLYQDGELLLLDATQGEIFDAVRERAYQYTSLNGFEPGEDFFYEFEVMKPVDFQFQKFLTTDKRDTFPKTFAVEGKNFID